MIHKIYKYILGVLGIGIIGGALAIGTPLLLDTIPDDLKLKVDKNKILTEKTVDYIVEHPDGTFENKGQMKKYSYVSDVKVRAEKYKKFDEDMSKRKGNAQFFPKGDNEWVAKFYTGETFYKDIETNDWFSVEHATTTVDAFETQTIGFVDRLVNKVFADEDIDITGTGDGRQWIVNSTWADVRDGTTAQDGDIAGTNGTIYARYDARAGEDNDYEAIRAYYPFDTSGLDDSAVIATSSVFIYWDAAQVVNANTTSLEIVESTQDSLTVLDTTDWKPVAWTSGSSKLLSAFSGAGYYEFVLNEAGRGWISLTGITPLMTIFGRELNDAIPTGYNTLTNVYFIEYTGTSRDPYLETSYTIVEASVEEVTQTPIMFQ